MHILTSYTAKTGGSTSKLSMCEHWDVYIPGRADGGEGGGSQGDAVQPTLLQQGCIVIGVLGLKKKKKLSSIVQSLIGAATAAKCSKKYW